MVVRALIFGGLLLLAKSSGFGFWLTALFLLASLFLYAQPIFNTFPLLTSFLVTIYLSLSLVRIANVWWVYLAALIVALMFYVLLRLKHLAFIDRQKWHYFLQLILFYLLYIVAFISYTPDSGIIWPLWVFIVAFLLLRELFRVQIKEGRHRLLFCWLVAFIISQFIWVAGLLPIGFISLANFLTLTTFLLIELTIGHWQGIVDKPWLLRRLLIFGSLAAIIFLTSRWSI